MSERDEILELAHVELAKMEEDKLRGARGYEPTECSRNLEKLAREVIRLHSIVHFFDSAARPADFPAAPASQAQGERTCNVGVDDSEFGMSEYCTAASSERGQMPEEPSVITRTERGINNAWTMEYILKSDYDSLRVHALSLQSDLDIAIADMVKSRRAQQRAESENARLAGEVEGLRIRGDGHAETLRGIARMDPATEGERMRLWALDGLSGYVEPVAATLKDALDRANAAESELQRLRREPGGARDAVIEECARVCERRRETRWEEHSISEPDTGAAYYSGRDADAYDNKDEEDEDCAAAIRALAR